MYYNMPFIYGDKLDFSGNKGAIRNLKNICDAYLEMHSGVRSQIRLTINSLDGWYSQWSGSFANTDISLNGSDMEHQQMTRQLSIILDMFHDNIHSCISSSINIGQMKALPIRFIIDDDSIVKVIEGTTDISGHTLIDGFDFCGNFYRDAKLSFSIGRMNNVGITFNPNLPYDFNDVFTTESNRFLNGRYGFRIGDFNTETVQVDLYNMTIDNLLSEGQNIESSTSFMSVLKRLESQIDFSEGLLTNVKCALSSIN